MGRDTAAIEKTLSEGLSALDIEHGPAQVDAFMLYLAELKKWNRAYNLTSLKTDADIVVKHFLDSALYLKALPRGVRSIADVGSGAGFPGLPLKILRPELMVHLIEPSQKKAAFLRNVVRKLGLKGVTVVERRAEDAEGFIIDAAVTRALFRSADFVSRAGHLVAEGGVLILSKGPKVKEELAALGLEHEVMEIVLPIAGVKRNLVIIRKGRAEAPIAGKAKHARRPPLRARPAGCANPECRLRRAGCTGFEGCPGFMARG